MRDIPYVPLRNGSRDRVSATYTTPSYSRGPGCKSVAEQVTLTEGFRIFPHFLYSVNPLNAELNPICHFLVLLRHLTFMGPCIVSIF
jgi:hypothetical protein